MKSMLALLPYLISPERKSICLHTGYQVTYSLFHFLLVSLFLAQRCSQNLNSEKRRIQLITFKMFWSSEGVFRDLEDRGEPKGNQEICKRL